MTTRRRLVVVGSGMVGQRFVEELLTRQAEKNADAVDRYDVTVIGAEPVPAYNRVLLSPLLAGELTPDDVALRLEAWYREQGVELLLGRSVSAIDRAARTLTLSDGTAVSYDLCVLATGSAPIRLPLPGADLNGVETFRDLRDVDAMNAFAKTGRPAVVIGGGLLGIETAYGLGRAGVPVTLIHLMDRLMERQLDAEAAALLKKALEAKGVAVELNAATEEVEAGPDGASVDALRLKDGRRFEAGLVAMAVGVKPRVDLGREAGLNVNRGIVVDDGLATEDPAVFALGECAEHRGAVYGLVEPGYAQARTLAERLTGVASLYEGSVLATNLKVSGVPVFSAGDFSGDGAELLVTRDAELGVYRKLCLRGGRLVGVVLVGDVTEALWYQQLIGAETPIALIRAALPFGKAYAEAA